MTLPRLNFATQISDQLNLLAAVVKARARVNLNDASHVLETVCSRFFNALFGWELTNLNLEKSNHPVADLGDSKRRNSMQITIQEKSEKITATTAGAIRHGFAANFDKLIIVFLLPKKPGFPKDFTQPPHGPEIETWDIADLLKLLLEWDDLAALEAATKVLDEELGRVSGPTIPPLGKFETKLRHTAQKLIGREAELAMLDGAWDDPHRNVVVVRGKGGEGKTSLVASWMAELAMEG